MYYDLDLSLINLTYLLTQEQFLINPMCLNFILFIYFNITGWVGETPSGLQNKLKN